MLSSSLKPSTSNDFADTLRDYVEATLHRPMELARWDGAASLPSFLSQRYDFFAALIGHQPCLFAADRGTVDATPADIAKHVARIETTFDGVVVYATQGLSADRRSRLVAGAVSFVVPGNQLYVPPLALDLRDNFHARPKRGLDQLSPVAQAVLFYGILYKHELRTDAARRTPSLLAKALDYSAMSVGRAFEELAGADLATVRKRGRSKEIEFADDGRSLIEVARPLLRNPVRTRKFMQGYPIVPPMKLAGENALGNITGLSPPRVTEFAVHGDDWSSLVAEHDIIVVGEAEQADIVVELWYYRPDVLTDYVTVDPLSLYAQYWDNPNERVAKAAEDALDHVSW
jgi:hypothetical protein